MSSLLVWWVLNFAASADAYDTNVSKPHVRSCGLKSTCSGQRARMCKSEDCFQRCPADGHRQCHSPMNSAFGCCCDLQVTKECDSKRAKCRFTVENGSCQIAMCMTVDSEVTCGNGCCKPSSHKSPKKCGKSLHASYNARRKRWTHAPCCVPQELTVAEQQDAACCIVDAGVDCTSHGQSAACCLWRQSAIIFDPDKHIPCQPSKAQCAGFEPCSRGLGFNCSELHEGHARRTCCLGAERSSVNDPCQPREDYCTSRYVPCPDGLGQRCDLKDGGKCCLKPRASDDHPCATDCDEWLAQQQSRKLLVTGIFVGIFVFMIGIVGFCIHHRQRFCQLCQRPRAPSLLLPAGQVMLEPMGEVMLQTLRQHSKRVALIISNQSYSGMPSGYRRLQCAHGDGDAIDERFRFMGYRTMRVQDATAAQIYSAFKSVLQWIADSIDALMVVYYAGHAVELPGQSAMWAGVDAPRADPSLHFSVQKCLQDIGTVHTVEGASRLGLQHAARNAFFVFLADCCRENSEVPRQFSAHLEEILTTQTPANPVQDRRERRRMIGANARAREQARLNRQNHSGPALEQAGHFYLSACRPGQAAFDTSDHDNRHSPFTCEILKHITSVQPLSSLAERISEGLGHSTANQQQAATHMEQSVGEQGGCISLAPQSFAIQRVTSSTGGSA